MTHFANGVELIECGLFRSLDWKRTILVGQQSQFGAKQVDLTVVIQDPLQLIFQLFPSSPSNSIASLKP